MAVDGRSKALNLRFARIMFYCSEEGSELKR
jgi:hypothetical protein